MHSHTVITVMLGMNRFHQKGTQHPFDMSALDGYYVNWLPQIQEIEKTNSTLFYEALVGVKNARKNKEYPQMKENFTFIFGRGTIDPASEKELFKTLQETMQHYGRGVNHIIIAKSFGVADTLTALSMFKPYHRKPNIQSLILIDGYLPPSKKKKIAKKVANSWYYKIPKFVKLYYNAVQRTKGTQGVLLEDVNRSLIVRQDYVDKFTKRYEHYSDSYWRKLEVSHFNMEEIVSVVPCIRLLIDFETLPQSIEKSITTYFI